MAKYTYICSQCETAGEIDCEQDEVEDCVCATCKAPIDLSQFVVGW